MSEAMLVILGINLAKWGEFSTPQSANAKFIEAINNISLNNTGHIP